MTLSVVDDIEYSGAAERPRMLTPEAFSRSRKYVPASTVMPAHRREPNSILRPFSWPNTSLIRNGTPRKGPLPERLLVEALDAVGIELDHGLHRGIDLLLGGDGRQRQLLRAHLLLGDQLGQAQGVIAAYSVRFMGISLH